MRRNKRNGQPDEGVCDVQHTVHSDELFVIRQHKRNGQPDQGVCDIRHAVHSDELFALRQETETIQYNKYHKYCKVQIQRLQRPNANVANRVISEKGSAADKSFMGLTQ